MWKAIWEKLEEIRNSDEGRKRKWVFGMSAICILMVVMLWFYYIDAVIKPTYNVAQKQEEKSRFWPVMKNGLETVGAQIKEIAANLFSKITNERAIEIDK